MRKILEFIKKYLSLFLNTLADCITPTITILTGVGMINVLLIILGPTVFNILSQDSDTYTVLSFVADAGFYFMPIFIAISSADVFKTNKYIAGFLGAMLLSPTFVTIVENNQTISVFGMPVALTNYDNQVIPSIISVWIMSLVYSFLDKKINDNFKAIVLPVTTILVMVPISFCVIGPLGVYLNNKLFNLIMYLSKLGPIGNGLVASILPFVIIFGLAGADVSAMLVLAASGCDPILYFANVIYNSVLGFVTLALYLRNKQSQCLAASITVGIGGASESALFGYVMKDTKALIIACIANFVAGYYSGLMGVKTFTMASFGVFGIMTTIGPGSSIVHAIISITIGCIIGFVLTYLTHSKTNS